MKNISYCSACQDFRKVQIIDNVKISEVIKNKEYTYIGKKAVCSECQEEVFDFTVNDYNLDKLDEEYRKVNGIIELSKVRELTEKYNIGKRPLSELLGFGEHTLSRYIDGDVPSKSKSEILSKVYEEPMYFLAILEENKDKISDVTYRKAKIQVDKIVNSKKIYILSIAKYILQYLHDIPDISIQKLLYYSQAFSLVFNKKPMFVDDCEAWAKGPVYNNVYTEYKHNREKFQDVNYAIDLKEDDKKIIDSVIYAFKDYSGYVLSEFTHLEDPWINARDGLSEEEWSREIIPIESINNYFLNVAEKYDIKTLDDICKYSEDMYRKYKEKEREEHIAMYS